MNIRLYTLFAESGALPLNPTYFFALTQRSKQKKSRLRLPLSKNLRSLAQIVQTRPDGIRRDSNRTILNRQLHLFFGSSDDVARLIKLHEINQ